MVGLVGVKVGDWLSGWMRVWVDSEQSVWIVVWVSGRFVGAWVGSQISETKTGNKITKFTWSHQASLPLTPNDDDLQWILAILEKPKHSLNKIPELLRTKEAKVSQSKRRLVLWKGIYCVSTCWNVFSSLCRRGWSNFFFFLPTKNDQGKPVLLSGFNLNIAHSSFNLLQTFSEFHFTDPVSLFVILYAQILQRKKSLWDKIPTALFRCLKAQSQGGDVLCIMYIKHVTEKT